MARKSAFTSLQLDTALLPARDQFPFWRDSKAEVVGIELERDAPSNAPFHIKRQCLQTGRLTLDRFQTQSQYRAVRTEKSMARTNLNVIQLLFCVSGTNKAAAFGEGTQTMGSQDIRVIDLERPFMTSDVGMSGYSIFLNRTHLLNELPSGVDLHGALLQDTALAKVLKRAIPVVFRELKHASDWEVETISETFHRFLTDTLRSQEIQDMNSAEISSRSKRTAVWHYIEQNYRDHSLTAGKIASALGMSKSTLYRTCDCRGSPSSLIQTIRLRKAAEALRTGQGSNIERLAYDLGYSCRQVFTRSFHREFGVSPGEYRIQAFAPRQDQANVRGRSPEVWNDYHTALVAAGRSPCFIGLQSSCTPCPSTALNSNGSVSDLRTI